MYTTAKVSPHVRVHTHTHTPDTFIALSQITRARALECSCTRTAQSPDIPLITTVGSGRLRISPSALLIAILTS